MRALTGDCIMARVKANERVRLSNGDIMTLREALDSKRLILRSPTHWIIDKITDKPKEVRQYLATDPTTGESFDVSPMMFKK
jgi:hypothetical protein